MSRTVPLVGRHPRLLALLALSLTAGIAAQPARGATDGGSSAGAGARAERKVRLDLVQADINDVAKALSIQSGVNVVLMPSVKGAVTVRLMDLSLEEALKKVVVAVGADL